MLLVGLASAADLVDGPAWEWRYREEYGYVGTTLGTGDFDGDGRVDLAEAGGTEDDENFSVYTHHTGVFYGAGGGLEAAPSWTPYGDAFSDPYSAVLAACDLDGDGYDELVRLNTESVALVYAGGPGGLASRPYMRLEAWTFACVGDTDGDGTDDLVVKQADDGALVLIAGGVPTWAATDATARGVPYAVGDVDGDGLADVGVVTDEVFDVVTASGAVRVRVGEVGVQEVVPVGDVDGDGVDDVLAVHPGAGEGHEGRLLLLAGGPEGPGVRRAWELYGPEAGAWLGYAAAGLGDVDGDGLADLAAALYLAGETGRSWPTDTMWVFRGSPDGPVATQTMTGAWGGTFAGGADLDEDGVPDLVAKVYVDLDAYEPETAVQTYPGRRGDGTAPDGAPWAEAAGVTVEASPLAFGEADPIDTDYGDTGSEDTAADDERDTDETRATDAPAAAGCGCDTGGSAIVGWMGVAALLGLRGRSSMMSAFGHPWARVRGVARRSHA